MRSLDKRGGRPAFGGPVFAAAAVKAAVLQGGNACNGTLDFVGHTSCDR